MMRALVQILINGLGVLLVSRLVPGIHFEGSFGYLLLVGLVMGLLNLTIKPLVTLLSLPMLILTLGLFFIVINGLMLYLAGALLGGLTVDGCAPALLGGIVLGIFNWALRALTKE